MCTAAIPDTGGVGDGLSDPLADALGRWPCLASSCSNELCNLCSAGVVAMGVGREDEVGVIPVLVSIGVNLGIAAGRTMPFGEAWACLVGAYLRDV